MRALTKTPEPFQGLAPNFMTPKVLAYYKLKTGQYAEISEGTGIQRQAIYGVTVRPVVDHDHDPSRLCGSLTAAYELVEALSQEEEV